MNITFFSSRAYEKPFIEDANKGIHQLTYKEDLLSEETISELSLAEAIVVFTNDEVSASVLNVLKQKGVKFVAIRATGYNNVDLEAATAIGISVANVPEYSPYSVAEHTVALVMALNRKLKQTIARVQQQNFTLDGLEGFDMNGKTVGIIGLGKIGGVVAKIMAGFGCTLLAYDPKPNPEYSKAFGVTYCSLDQLYEKADIITLHAPLHPSTQGMINKESIKKMKNGVMIVNCGRGGLVTTEDAIIALKSGKIGSMGLDVYEKEKGVFFFDYSNKALEDSLLQTLITMENVLVTPHMAFLTKTALKNIADTTFENISKWSKGEKSEHELTI